MAVTVSGTSITFNDATVQTTAAVAPSTAYDGVGSYVAAYYGITNPNTTVNRVSCLANGTVVAGSSLRVSSRATANNFIATADGPFVAGSSAFARSINGGTSFPTGNSTTLSGTWRCMMGGTWSYSYDSCGTVYVWVPLLWVRIS